MNKEINLGEINTLKISRVSEPGLYLKALNEEEVLLPNAYINKEMEIDSLIDVFIYTDSEDRLVATTLIPYGYKNSFASLEVVDTTKFGAFLDMGLPKDLLVPKNKQRSSFNIGDKKLIKIIEDEKTHRLIGTEKFQLDKIDCSFKQNEEVEIIPYIKTPLGFKVIVNNRYPGLIYHNEIFEKVEIGNKKRAYVKNIRDDGKIDISLQKIGLKRSDDNLKKVLDILNENNGELNFTYKSDSNDIKETFAMSKKAFKASLTKLIETKKIILTETSIKAI